MPLPARVAVLTLVGCVVTFGVLIVMGQVPWCACGSPVPWSWDIWSEHNSQHVLDPYLFSHVLHGVIFYAVLTLLKRWVRVFERVDVRYGIALAIEMGWEILENSPIIIQRYRDTASQDYLGDSAANSTSDLLMCAGGFWLTRFLPWWGALIVVAVFELGTLVWVRDNLTLNVIMLIYPIEAIKQWQLPG